LEQKLSANLSGKGTAKIKDYSTNKISITANSTGDNLLFLSDSYYPGWQAYIDGNKTQIYRADFAFRAVLIPKGEHVVEFVYRPLSFTVGVLFAGVSLMIILVLALVGKRGFTLLPRT